MTETKQGTTPQTVVRYRFRKADDGSVTLRVFYNGVEHASWEGFPDYRHAADFLAAYHSGQSLAMMRAANIAEVTRENMRQRAAAAIFGTYGDGVGIKEVN